MFIEFNTHYVPDTRNTGMSKMAMIQPPTTYIQMVQIDI